MWFGDSRARVKDFPADARRVTGYELEKIQDGREPDDWKPMPSVGLGVNEVRVWTGDAFRLIYLAKFAEAVYVLHAFQKKSEKTAQADIELARRRFRALIEERRRR